VEFVLPRFDLSIANVPSTVARLLGARLPGAASALPQRLWADLSVDVRRVVFVILDAVGWLRFRHMLLEEPDHLFNHLSRRGRLVPLTSVFPCTTTSALTTLWTGHAPAQHGLVGNSMYLPDFDEIVDMLGFSPAGQPRDGQMVTRGLVPEEFPSVPGLAETLAEQGVSTQVLIRHDMVDSPLSRLCFRGVAEVEGIITLADMWVRAAERLATHADERLLLVVYWSEVDAISHYRGPDSRSWRAELRNVAFSLQREFLQQLSAVERDGTLLVITADHGQAAGSEDSSVLISDHPRLQDCLLMAPAGGPRAAYLHTHVGRKEEARRYIREHLAREFAVIESSSALESGLLGPGLPAPSARRRLGDLMVLARGHHMLDRYVRTEPLRGMHGGLSPWEMLVPLLMVRLDQEPGSE
jgi:hypothetical protein